MSGREPIRSHEVRDKILIALALVALTVLVYRDVGHHAFVNFDDAQYVSQNQEVLKGLSWHGVEWAFSATHAGNWHPLTWLSHMLDVTLFGPEPGAHHLVNVAFHAANTVLLFWLLVWTTRARWPSAVVAALFAVHPLHVESVAWIAERKDVLSTFFLMLTLIAYVSWVRQRGVGRYAAVCVLFALGLMSKPMLVTLPFLLFLVDRWPLGIARLEVLPKLPLLAMAAASSVVTFIVQQGAGAVKALDALPLAQRLANAAVAYAMYVVKAIWPSDLAAIYPYQIPIPVWQLIGALVLIAVATTLAVRVRRKAPYVLVGWLWFLGTLVPVIGLVQVGSQPFADRYTYVPAIGLFIIAVWGLPAVCARWLQAGPALAGAAVVVVTGCTFLSVAQTAVWRDSVTLWRHALLVTSSNYRAHTNLGQALMTDGHLDDAIDEYRRALAIKPDFAQARNYLGAALADTGHTTEAIVEFKAALAAFPDYAEAHNNLGLAYAAGGNFTGAIDEFKEAARLRPGFTAARSNLGGALAEAGRYDEAIQELTAALAAEPGAERTRLNLALAWRDRGEALIGDGRLDEALQSLIESATMVPRDADVHYDIGVVLARKGQVAEAIKELRLAIDLNPGHEPAKRALAALTK